MRTNRKWLVIGTSGAVLLAAAMAILFWTGEPQTQAIELAKSFVSNTVGNEWLVLDSPSQIPFEKGDPKNPSDYRSIVEPTAKKVNDNTVSVALCTWTKYEGALVKWEVRITSGKVTHVYAEVIDKGIGHYVSVGFEGSRLPEPGRVLIDEDVDNR